MQGITLSIKCFLAQNRMPFPFLVNLHKPSFHAPINANHANKRKLDGKIGKGKVQKKKILQNHSGIIHEIAMPHMSIHAVLRLTATSWT